MRNRRLPNRSRTRGLRISADGLICNVQFSEGAGAGSGGTLPSTFPFHPPIPSPFLPYREEAPENQVVGMGSALSSSSGVRGEAAAANAFWCILSSKIAPGGVDFSNTLRKKELYRPET